ncbi:hypothetical protein ASC61_08010 [Aeromicrobium sp. Root344]|uniref:alpha/beta hydrolase n=1 Tax=Aeromicrobium sp. Root344 TaxID=1736521 RepID=UPI0006FC692C|nr:alpha/beta hydrolase [Aeromicrobium sp. Root344]KQV74946.1 hypothetical protein ASC61_08010 [Aeromicrobium sp. Root344]
MVTRTAGPFEYWEVTGDAVRAAAAGPATNATVIQSLAGELEGDEVRAARAIEGDISAGVVANPHAASTTAHHLAAHGQYAVGLLRMFGADVDRFDETVDGINVDYHSRVSSALDAARHGPDPHGGPIDTTAVTAGIETDLKARYLKAQGVIDDAADTIASMFRQGPTDDNVRDLIRAGLIPLASASLYPTLTLTADDTRAALKAAVHAMVLRMIEAGTLPPEVGTMSPDDFRAYLIEHPDLATRLYAQEPRPGSEWPEGVLAALTMSFMTSPGGADEVLEHRREDARALFESLGPADAAMLAMLFPRTVGNLSGVPFANRADANDVSIIAALDAERDDLADLERRHQHNQHDWDFLGLNNDDLEGPIGDSKDRISLYESILRNDRQILLFDPSGDGAIAELHGTIGASTKNLGVLVPGTGTDLSSFQGVADRANNFVENSRPGELAMISWMGGDLPDSIVKDAPFANYARDLGPLLAGFSHDVRQEAAHSAGAANDIHTTYAGHSYGGAVVGRSELAGLDADRVLHIESAGMGHDIEDLDDLPASQRDVDRYSMTAPGDIIGDIQGMQVGDNIGHGADPDTFEGTLRLDTGNKAGSDEPNIGVDSHTSVFQEHSDAWRNMLEVFNGGTVTGYRQPDYYLPPTPYAQPVQTGWATPGERIDIP